jgi:tetratricopeptide (TPR) repeat protein
VALHLSRAPRPRAAADVLRSVFPFGLLLMMIYASAGLAAGTCTPPLARLTSAQGLIESQRDAGFRPVARNAEFCPGDVIRVGPRSRAGLRLSNETYIPLDQNTQIKLNGFDESGKASFIDLDSGVIHIITRTPKPIRIRTPFMNAMVEGTEFFVAVGTNDARVGVVEGKVRVTNDLGDLLLADNEAAITERGQAPRKDLTIKPRDAVQWALYYPPIVDPILFGQAAQDQASPFAQAAQLYREGRAAEAIANLESVPQDARKAPYHSYLAALLLSVGRVDEAQQAIERELADNAKNGLALGLQAIIAIAQNRKEEALKTAQAATEADPKSSPAHIALSYAQQANFKLEDALASAKKAIELAPNDALAHARRAELEMSMGELDRALAAAKRATELNPNIARTQTILGFANLTRIDTKAAKQAFEKSIELEQADPLPRLGLGLAKIREGELQAGREEIEIATSLDPENSLIRSYLGKAYYEEKRDQLAGVQFELAKERDPKDPTPYFYDAIRKQTENRPVEALQDLNRSIERNNNRGVYRSKLLLDEDFSVRGAGIARIYDDLGFEQLGLLEASHSLSLDPRNHSAHRLTSDMYARLARHEIARVSELLQAQLLQPLSVDPVQPSIAATDLGKFGVAQPAQASFNEFSPLFERNRPQLVVSGFGGNLGTLGDEVVLSGVADRFSYSVGQYHYETDGFRPNNDLRQSIFDLFAQFALSPTLSVQTELRQRHVQSGDLSLNFDPDAFEPALTDNIRQDIARVGMRFSPTPSGDFLFSFIRSDFKDTALLAIPEIDFSQRDTKHGNQFEVQYLSTGESHSYVLGLGSYRLKSKLQNTRDFTKSLGVACPEGLECVFDNNTTDTQDNVYVYANSSLPKGFTLTFGLSAAHYSDLLQQGTRETSPKFGLSWSPMNAITLRLAGFKTLKRGLVANQTIEPTQLMGFNQFFDDISGTIARVWAGSVGMRFGENVSGGVRTMRRYLRVPGLVLTRDEIFFEHQQEDSTSIYLYWTPTRSWALRVEHESDRFRFRPAPAPVDIRPSRVTTSVLPVAARYSNASGFFAEISPSWVRQTVDRQNVTDGPAGKDAFVVVDATLGWRFGRTGIVTLEGRNLLDEKFFYEDDNAFRTTEIRLPRFTPARSILVRANVRF